MTDIFDSYNQVEDLTFISSVSTEDDLTNETEEEKEERLRKEEEERLRLLEEQEVEESATYVEDEPILSEEELQKFASYNEVEDLTFVESVTPRGPITDAGDLKNTPYIIKRKLDYGATQEPMILGSLFRLGSAKVRSLLTDKTYSEAAKEIEQERQDVIQKDFPLLYGKDEDALIILGRVGTALADPVTFFIPWTKIAKTGKIATTAVGAGVSSADIALREESLYGEVSGKSVALAAGLGGASSVLSQMFISGKVTRDSFETIGKNGVKIKKVIDLGDGLKVPNPLLVIKDKQKLAREVEKYKKTGEEILGQHGKIMQKLVDTTKNIGFHETRKEVISLDIKNLKDDLFKIKKEQGGINQVVDFMGNPVELSGAKRARTLLEKAEKELVANETTLQKLYTEQLSKDFAETAYIQITTALKNGIFEEEGMVRYFMQELTAPMFGAIGGLGIGLMAADEDSSRSNCRFTFKKIKQNKIFCI